MREQVETMRIQPYQYRHCGLENVYLVNGYTIKDSPYGEAISIHDMDGLHRAIGMYLVREKKTLTGPEARFLRHELDLSQRTLGELLDKSSQAVARWEKGKSRIDGPSDRLLRLLYIQRCSTGTGKVETLLERLAELDNQTEALVQFENDNGWHLRIAA